MSLISFLLLCFSSSLSPFVVAMTTVRVTWQSGWCSWVKTFCLACSLSLLSTAPLLLSSPHHPFLFLSQDKKIRCRWALSLTDTRTDTMTAIISSGIGWLHTLVILTIAFFLMPCRKTTDSCISEATGLTQGRQRNWWKRKLETKGGKARREKNLSRERERNWDSDKDGKCKHTVTGTQTRTHRHTHMQWSFQSFPPVAGWLPMRPYHSWWWPSMCLCVQMVLTSRPSQGI